MTGNGEHTTYQDGDDWGNGLWHCFTHIDGNEEITEYFAMT